MNTIEQQTAEAAVRQLFQQLTAAWAAGDAKAYAALFTADADYVAFDGVNRKEHTAIEAGHKPLSAFSKATKLTGDLVDVQLLAPDVVLAHAVGSICQCRTHHTQGRSSIESNPGRREGRWGMAFSDFSQYACATRITGGISNLLTWALADLFWGWLGQAACSFLIAFSLRPESPHWWDYSMWWL